MKTQNSSQLDKTTAAKLIGSLGGQKTALRGPDYYRQIGAKGLAKRDKKKEENE